MQESTSCLSSQPFVRLRAAATAFHDVLRPTLNSICAANVVVNALLQRVPGPWSGIDMPAGGAECPHVIWQLFAHEVVQPVRRAASSCTAIHRNEGQCSFHGRRTGGAWIVSNTDACRYACRAITVEMSCRRTKGPLSVSLSLRVANTSKLRQCRPTLVPLSSLVSSPCMLLRFTTTAIFLSEAPRFPRQPMRLGRA
jgi:hypothetical protein